mmetsp:Transcript_14543/g.38903  ORF Transcript_14543/g.38903 Transcript_14543/m.38903 type:complete len:102 (-) Transcript_14543:852-1157(-)
MSVEAVFAIGRQATPEESTESARSGELLEPKFGVLDTFPTASAVILVTATTSTELYSSSQARSNTTMRSLQHIREKVRQMRCMKMRPRQLSMILEEAQLCE